MMYVGLDVHKKVCYGTVMDENGTVVKQAKFTNIHEALDGFMKDLHEARVVMEAGYCWQPLYDRLEEAGHDVRLAHPKGVKALTKKKTDRTDSETLRTPPSGVGSSPDIRNQQHAPPTDINPCTKLFTWPP